MELPIPTWLWATVPIVFFAGLIVGRIFSTATKRIKILTAEIENTKANLEQTRMELDQTKATLEQTRNETARYRQKVTEHFSTTADLFNSLTANYRAVYEHLAMSSHALCDEPSVMLSEPLPSERLLSKDAEDY